MFNYVSRKVSPFGKLAEFSVSLEFYGNRDARARRSSLHSGTYGSFQDGYLIGCGHVGCTYTRRILARLG